MTVERIWVSRPHLTDFLFPYAHVTDDFPVSPPNNELVIKRDIENGLDVSPLHRKQYGSFTMAVSDYGQWESLPRHHGYSQGQFDRLLEEPSDYKDLLCETLDLKDYKYLENVKDLENEDLDMFVKRTSAEGYWYKEAWQSESSASAYDLLKAYDEGRNEFVRATLEAFDDNEPGVVMSSLLTFLRKVKEYDPKSFDGNEYYQRQIRAVVQQDLDIRSILTTLCKLDTDLKLVARVLVAHF